MRLRSHVPIFIDVRNLQKIVDYILNLGFYYTKLQVIYPGVIYGRVITADFEGTEVDLHFRCFKSGKIEAEYEHRRLKSMRKHLTTKSYSAHEWVIEMLEHLDIEFSIDEDLRKQYNDEIPRDFPHQPFRWLHWLVVLCLFVSTAGVIWRAKEFVKHKLKGSSHYTYGK